MFWYFLYLNGHLFWWNSFCASMFTSATICIVVSTLFRVKLVFSVLCQRPSSCFAAKSWTTMCVLLRLAVWVVHCKTYGSWSSAVKMLQVGRFYCAFFLCAGWILADVCSSCSSSFRCGLQFFFYILTLLENRGSPLLKHRFLLWSAYFGQSDSAALESSGVTRWALMLSDTPPLLYEGQRVCVCVTLLKI